MSWLNPWYVSINDDQVVRFSSKKSAEKYIERHKLTGEPVQWNVNRFGLTP